VIRLTHHQHRCRGPLYPILALTLVFCCPFAVALELRLGGEFSYSEYTLEGRNEQASLEPLGPGVSLGISDAAGWSIQLRYANQDDRMDLGRNSSLDYELETWGAQAGYTWAGDTSGRALALFWQRDREELSLRASSSAAPALEPRFLEDTTTQALGIEFTHFWYRQAWSPSLSAGLIGLSSDTERRFRQAPDNGFILTGEGEDTLEGLDATLSAGIDYLWPISGNSALIPHLGLTYQRSLAGDISRSSTTGFISRRGRRAFSSQDSSQTLEGQDQLSLQGGIDGLFGPWSLSLSVAQPLLTEPLDTFFLVEIAYSWQLGD